MNKPFLIIGLLALGAAAGCGDDDLGPFATAPGGTTGGGTTVTTRTVALTAQGTPSSNVTGTATIRNETGANSTVTVALSGTGVAANVQHAGQVRAGTCAAPGAARHTLASTATGNTAGSATSTNSNNVPDTALTTGGVIVFYATAATTSAVVACGAL
jgi:hypothetical protein